MAGRSERGRGDRPTVETRRGAEPEGLARPPSPPRPAFVVDAGGRVDLIDEPDDRAVYVISIAAELAGVHPQTLRIYERKGLLSPKRTAGKARRYSAHDIQRLRTIQELTQRAGVNLAGVKLIMEMQDALEVLQLRAARLEQQLESSLSEAHGGRGSGAIVPSRSWLLFPWEPREAT